jgi:hypothetical protein
VADAVEDVDDNSLLTGNLTGNLNACTLRYSQALLPNFDAPLRGACIDDDSASLESYFG